MLVSTEEHMWVCPGGGTPKHHRVSRSVNAALWCSRLTLCPYTLFFYEEQQDHTALKTIHTKALPFKKVFFALPASISILTSAYTSWLIYPCYPWLKIVLSFTGPYIYVQMTGFVKLLQIRDNVPRYNMFQLQICWHTSNHLIVLETFYWKCENRKCIIA